MDANKILIALDDSDASQQAVSYVADMVPDTGVDRILLVHVLSPLPPSLLEHQGSESEATEAKLEAHLHRAQEHWRESRARDADSMFATARDVLTRKGVPAESVHTRCICPTDARDVAAEVVEHARARDYGTIVVGRESFHGLRKLLHRFVSDDIVQHGKGIAVWVVA